MLKTLFRRWMHAHYWIRNGDRRHCPRCGKRQVYVPDCGGWSTGWWEDET